MRRYLAAQVLIIGEVGYTKLTEEQSNLLFALVRDRDEVGSIILTSNISVAEWGALLGNEVLATALLDQLLHHAEEISIQGRRYRMKNRQTASKNKSEGRSKRRKEDEQQQQE